MRKTITKTLYMNFSGEFKEAFSRMTWIWCQPGVWNPSTISQDLDIKLLSSYLENTRERQPWGTSTIIAFYESPCCVFQMQCVILLYFSYPPFLFLWPNWRASFLPPLTFTSSNELCYSWLSALKASWEKWKTEISNASMAGKSMSPDGSSFTPKAATIY